MSRRLFVLTSTVSAAVAFALPGISTVAWLYG